MHNMDYHYGRYGYAYVDSQKVAVYIFQTMSIFDNLRISLGRLVLLI